MGERFNELMVMSAAIRSKLDLDTAKLFTEYSDKLAKLAVDAVNAVEERKEEESGVTITVEATEVK